MRNVFLQSLEMMHAAFRRLERHVPAPKWVLVHDAWTWRYEEQTILQAIVQKLARYVSGLHATDVLLAHGLIQEQLAIQRILDELGEDILFLSLAVIKGEITPTHDRYLQEFWAEEFDDPNPLKSTQKRGMIRRSTIRSYAAQAGALADPHAWHTSGNTVYKTFSGYLHCASPQIMDMVGGDEAGIPRFHLSGMAGTPRVREGMLSAWNYFLRGLMAFVIAAKAFGDAKLVEALTQALESFEKTDPGLQ